MSRKSLRVETHAFGAPEQALPANLRKRAIASATRLGSGAPASGGPGMRVAFIGLDPIGKAMASRLLEAGHQLTVYDPDRGIPEAIESAGASVANSIQDACRWADAVFTRLADDQATEAAILGPGGVVESLPRNAIHIGSSTVSVECADRIVEAHWDAGKKYVSAPVLVGSESTAEVQLLVIAGGRAATIFQIEPLLGPIGQLAQLSGWPSEANLVQLASIAGAAQFPFLARHPELRDRQDRSQPARPESSLARFLGIGTEGVLQ